MWPRQGATALVLGAGGAAAAVALALTRVPLLRLRIAARRDAARCRPRRSPARIRRHRNRAMGSRGHRRDRRALRDRGQRNPGRARVAAIRSAIGSSGVQRRRPPLSAASGRRCGRGHRDGPSRERRAGDAPAAGVAELLDLDRQGRACGCGPQRAGPSSRGVNPAGHRRRHSCRRSRRAGLGLACRGARAAREARGGGTPGAPRLRTRYR